MLILIYHLFFNVLLPQLVVTAASVAYAFALPAMLIIAIAVIVSFKSSGNITGTVVNSFLKAIGFIFVQIFKAISYILKQLWNLTPTIYRNCKSFYGSFFTKKWISSFLSVLTVIIIWLVII